MESDNNKVLDCNMSECDDFIAKMGKTLDDSRGWLAPLLSSISPPWFAKGL